MKLFARHKQSKWRYCEILPTEPDILILWRRSNKRGIPIAYAEIDGKEVFYPEPSIGVEIERVMDA